MNIILLFSFIWGTFIGSFLNVLIVRLPQNQDFVFSRSKCVSCKKEIPWYCNIPILSIIFLGFKCLYCKSRISFMYPITELVLGVASILLLPSYLNASSLLDFFIEISIVSVFWTIIIIDLRHKIIPDILNIYLCVIFLINGFLKHSWDFWLAGFGIGLCFPLFVTYIFYKLRGVVGLGGGDIKLFAVLGLILGPYQILNNIFVSCFLGALVGSILILLKIIDKNTKVPFGPSIIIVAFFQIFFPDLFRQLLGKVFII